MCAGVVLGQNIGEGVAGPSPSQLAGLGERGVWGGAATEIEFCAF